MKKAFAAMLLVLMLSLTACGSTAPKMDVAADADGNRTIKDQYGTTVYPSELPCSLQYNGEVIAIKGFELYQMESDYEWYLFALVDIDMSNLSDKGYHWLFEDKDIDCSVYLDKGANKFDFANMEQLGNRIQYTDVKQYKICWISPITSKYKESFENTEVHLSVRAKQEDGTYYSVLFTPGTEEILDVAAMDSTTDKFVSKRLEEEKLSLILGK